MIHTFCFLPRAVLIVRKLASIETNLEYVEFARRLDMCISCLAFSVLPVCPNYKRNISHMPPRFRMGNEELETGIFGF